jgi:hypothetical protein
LGLASVRTIRKRTREHFILEALPLLETTTLMMGIPAVLSESDASKSE